MKRNNTNAKILQWTTMLLLALLPICMLGCGQSSAGANTGEATDDGRIKVVTTIFPPYDFARQIAGGHAQVSMLLPPGAESHSFEPSPKDIISIQECDIFIYVGGNSDSWIDDILDTLDTDNMTIISMMDLVSLKEEIVVEGMEPDHDEADHALNDHGNSHDDDHSDHDHSIEPHTHGYDEHVWTSPKNAALISQAIADELCRQDANNAPTYRANAEQYIAQLEQLDARFSEIVAAGKRDTLVFGDRFPFRYLADEYGLQYYAAFPGCSTQTEPSAATVAFLIDKVREEGIPVVFHIEGSNQQMAKTICAETDAITLQLHSCHNLTQAELDSGATYISLMQQNAAALEEALQ